MNQPTPTSPGGALARPPAVTPMEANLGKAEVSLSLLEPAYPMEAERDLISAGIPWMTAERFNPARVSPHTWRRVRSIMDQNPAVDLRDIDEHLSKVQAAASAPPHRKATIALIVMLLDSFKRCEVSDDFRGAALYDVLAGGYSPAVVSLACQRIRRTATFLPSIAELLAACEEAKARWRSAPIGLRKTRTVLERAQAVYATPEPAEPLYGATA